MTAHDSEEGEFRSRQCAGQAPEVETRFIARVGAAGAVRGEEFSALFSQHLAAEGFADQGCGALRDYLLCYAQMQPGVQLLHAKRAGRFQRRVADERDDHVVESKAADSASGEGTSGEPGCADG